jgi:Arm DNA-binding domain
MKKLIADRALKAIKPTGKRRILWDSSVPNFCVIVSAKGKVNFAVIRRLSGSRTPLTRRLGQFPIMALAQAREAALEALREFSAGVDPAGRAGS